MSLEIHKMLVLSIAHMSARDSELLDGEAGPVHYDLGEYGWLLYVNPQMIDEHCDLSQFSYGFKQSILAAQAKGCDYLRFDRDANEVEGIVTYDW